MQFDIVERASDIKTSQTKQFFHLESRLPGSAPFGLRTASSATRVPCISLVIESGTFRPVQINALAINIILPLRSVISRHVYYYSNITANLLSVRDSETRIHD